ncbi:hypothetical protein BH10ACT11_BH10ACT11_02830 [soil metagenome]
MGTEPRHRPDRAHTVKESDRGLGRWAAIDRRVAELAAKQHRAVSTGQLLEAGLTKRSIHTRVERGWLVRAHRGVYWVGGPAGPRSYEMAAVLALGRGAFLSHLSAAYFHKLLPYPASYQAIDGPLTVSRHSERGAANATLSRLPPIDVSIAIRRPGRRSGIDVHRATLLERGDVRIVDAIAASTPARTLIEVAAVAPHLLDDAYDEAVFPPKSFVQAELASLLTRFSGRPGVRALRTLHESEAADDRSRRRAEKELHTLIASAGLPMPKVNAPIGRYRIDFLWPAEKVAIEMDGFAEHGKRRSFESDRARDAELQARGYRVIRVTWRQLTQRPNEVIARIDAVLAIAGRLGAG